MFTWPGRECALDDNDVYDYHTISSDDSTDTDTSDTDTSDTDTSDTDTSDTNSTDSCCHFGFNGEREKPLKEGFERIYASCGSFYDREILRDGEERCDACEASVKPEKLFRDDKNKYLKSVCSKCLDNGSIVRCSKCGTFVNKFMFGWMFFSDKMIKELYGNSIYCNKCVPPLIFTYIISEPYSTTIELPIPADKMSGIHESYFYKYLADKLGISVDRILIGGHKCRDVMWCPIEFTKPKHRIFNVTIA
ncbi:putative orfan [Tupanvirus soda lake]|uniref:Orfan n=2 Tax=Tupanvirus TaxID=2094720 RepID=A0AC62AC04_9VIRU|nr:putative orfan [Tupanvirus soda lake]QKU35296.1 putative orfan [Tupanvirus soda lake]